METAIKSLVFGTRDLKPVLEICVFWLQNLLRVCFWIPKSMKGIDFWTSKIESSDPVRLAPGRDVGGVLPGAGRRAGRNSV